MRITIDSFLKAIFGRKGEKIHKVKAEITHEQIQDLKDADYELAEAIKNGLKTNYPSELNQVSLKPLTEGKTKTEIKEPRNIPSPPEPPSPTPVKKKRKYYKKKKKATVSPEVKIPVVTETNKEAKPNAKRRKKYKPKTSEQNKPIQH